MRTKRFVTFKRVRAVWKLAVPASVMLGLGILVTSDSNPFVSRAGAEDVASADTTEDERSISLLYTVNNLGYTDTCG